VVERKVGANLYVTAGLEMARTAAGHILLLFFRLVKVADETFHVGHDHVSALNDLRVTGRAAELLLPFHLLDMLAVVEDNIPKDEVALQILPIVATALQAARIIYLGMCLGGALSGDEVCHRQLAVFPLALQVVHKPGLVMAVDAGHVAVGRRLPGLHIDRHVVADTAEEGLFRDLIGGDYRGENTDKDEAKEYDYALLVPLRARL